MRRHPAPNSPPPLGRQRPSLLPSRSCLLLLQSLSAAAPPSPHVRAAPPRWPQLVLLLSRERAGLLPHRGSGGVGALLRQHDGREGRTTEGGRGGGEVAVRTRGAELAAGLLAGRTGELYATWLLQQQIPPTDFYPAPPASFL